MKDEDVKIGMKVVAHQKTAGYRPYLPNLFLYVLRIEVDSENKNKVWVLDSDPNSTYGDYYNAEDFEPYIESSEEEVSEEKVIVAQWVIDLFFGKIMRVIQSNHTFFPVGSLFDFAFIERVRDSGYTVIIKPMGDKGK